MRKTKIVATIGPVSESSEMLIKLIEKGVNIFRLNLSHNSRKWHENVINRIRKISKNVEILIDTRGPEIRLGDFAGNIELKENDIFYLVADKNLQSEKDKKIHVSYSKINKNVKIGDKIAFDGGMLFGFVEDVDKKQVKCRALSDWVLTSRRHVNLPGERVDLPTMNENDIEDLKYFSQFDYIDYVALSFTRCIKDVLSAKKIIPKVKIIAKIENFEGINNFEEILQNTYGIMVARGDLGVEMPLEKIPIFQRKMVRKVRESQKFVIIATEMLESMTKSPRPTRAEVSDVATAVWQEADAVMLSEETAMGKYPLQTVETMRKIIEYTEEEMAVLP